MLTTPFTSWRGIYLRPACVWCKTSFLPPHPVCKPEGAGRISLTLGNTSLAPRERAFQGTALYPAPPMLPLRVHLSKWGHHPSGGERRDALEKVAHSFLGSVGVSPSQLPGAGQEWTPSRPIQLPGRFWLPLSVQDLQRNPTAHAGTPVAGVLHSPTDFPDEDQRLNAK